MHAGVASENFNPRFGNAEVWGGEEERELHHPGVYRMNLSN